MKNKIKVLIVTVIFSLGILAQSVSAATTYYVDTPSMEEQQFYRAVATGDTEFTIIYNIRNNEDYVATPDTWATQEYANNDYIYYNGGSVDADIEESEDGNTIKIDFYVSSNETPEQTKYVYDKIHNLIKENPSILEATRYEKAAWAYDWITSNIKGDYSYKNNTAYSALTDSTDCEGYSLLFYAFATELGLNCRVVIGSAYDGTIGEHEWNILELGGKWYYVDTTWGAAYGRKYFLKAKNNVTSHYLATDYTTGYFNFATSDYVDTGNSGHHGVLASVYDIKFDPLKKITLEAGDNYNWMLSNPNSTKLTFTSDSESIAKVDSGGKVTAVGAGTTTVRAVNDELGIEQTCEVTVTAGEPIIASIKKVSVKYNSKAKISYTTSPANTTLKNVKYYSKNSKIAKVDSKGNVTGVRAGETEIEVYYGTNKMTTVPVVVNPYVKTKTATVKVNKSVGIGNAIQVSSRYYVDLIFKSSNTKIATVSTNGLVKGVKKGTCKIYVYDKSNKKAVGTVSITVN